MKTKSQIIEEMKKLQELADSNESARASVAAQINVLTWVLGARKR